MRPRQMKQNMEDIRNEMSDLSLEQAVDKEVEQIINGQTAAQAARHAHEAHTEQASTSRVKNRIETIETRTGNGENKKAPSSAEKSVIMPAGKQPESRGLLGWLNFGKASEASEGVAREKQYERSEAGMAALEADFHQLQGELRRYRARIEQNAEETKQLRQDDYNHYLAHNQKVLARHEQDEKAHAQEIANLKQEAARDFAMIQKEKMAAEKACKDYEQKISSLEKSVRDFQAGALQSVESAQWAPLSSSEIEHKIKNILAGVRQWSNKYGTLTIDELLNPERFKIFTKRLTQLGCLNSPDGLWEALRQNKSMQKQGKASALLLAAVVSALIVHELFGNPFFAFAGTADDEDMLWEGHGTSLKDVVDLLGVDNEKGAEAWRCELLRLLDPMTITKRSREAAATKLSTELMGKMLGAKGGSTRYTEAHQELTNLMNQAAEMSWLLWTRKARIEVLDLPALKERGFTESIKKFSVKSAIFEPHSTHGKDLDDDPEALNGREVLLLCSPVVMAAGNADGGDYQKRRLLKKAIVWLG